jgi:hypothetical protein
MFSLKEIEQSEADKAKAVLQMRMIEGSLPVEKKVRVVLDEETYVEGMEKIITRDYFPDLWRIQEYKKYKEEKAVHGISEVLSSNTGEQSEAKVALERDTDRMTLAQYTTKYTR